MSRCWAEGVQFIQNKIEMDLNKDVQERSNYKYGKITVDDACFSDVYDNMPTGVTANIIINDEIRKNDKQDQVGFELLDIKYKEAAVLLHRILINGNIDENNLQAFSAAALQMEYFFNVLRENPDMVDNLLEQTQANGYNAIFSSKKNGTFAHYLYIATACKEDTTAFKNYWRKECREYPNQVVYFIKTLENYLKRTHGYSLPETDYDSVIKTGVNLETNIKSALPKKKNESSLTSTPKSAKTDNSKKKSASAAAINIRPNRRRVPYGTTLIEKTLKSKRMQDSVKTFLDMVQPGENMNAYKIYDDMGRYSTACNDVVNFLCTVATVYDQYSYLVSDDHDEAVCASVEVANKIVGGFKFDLTHRNTYQINQRLYLFKKNKWIKGLLLHYLKAMDPSFEYEDTKVNFFTFIVDHFKLCFGIN